MAAWWKERATLTVGELARVLLGANTATNRKHVGGWMTKLKIPFVEIGGLTQPAPAPRFSRTPGEISRPSPHPGQHTDEALTSWGLSDEELQKLRDASAIA